MALVFSYIHVRTKTFFSTLSISSEIFIVHLGRRVAELEIHIALAHIIRTYTVEYLEKEPMDYIQHFLVKPERQLDLVFKKI